MSSPLSQRVLQKPSSRIMSLSKTSPPVSNANPVGNGPLPTARLPASARVPASDPKNECNPHLQKRISHFVLHTRYEDLPPDVLHEAKRALIDTIGVAAGAQCLPIAKACRRFASLSGETEPTTLSGSTRWTSPLWFDLCCNKVKPYVYGTVGT